MKIVVAVLVAGLLAACGGGGSGGGVTVLPTATPHTGPQTTAYILVTGKDQGRQSASRYVRHAEDTSPGPVPTSQPIYVEAPDCTMVNDSACANSAFPNYPGTGDTVAQAQVQVSPAPSSSSSPAIPTVSGTPAATDVTASQNGAPNNVNVESTQPNVYGTGSVSVAYGGTSASTNYYVLHGMSLSCWPSDVASSGSSIVQSEYWQGVTISNTVVSQATTPASADIYFTGQGCWGNFTGPEAIPTLHAPYGMTVISSKDNDINGVTFSQYTGSQTSIDIATIVDDAHQRAHPEDIVLVNTALGEKYLFFLSLNNRGQGNPETGVMVHGPLQRHGDGPLPF